MLEADAVDFAGVVLAEASFSKTDFTSDGFSSPFSFVGASGSKSFTSGILIDEFLERTARERRLRPRSVSNCVDAARISPTYGGDGLNGRLRYSG